jgi:hypothetical protein
MDFIKVILKLPESSIFWAIVSIGVFIGLCATHHVATAFTFALAAVSVICFISNVVLSIKSKPIPALWVIAAVSLFLALGIGLTSVQYEWK